MTFCCVFISQEVPFKGLKIYGKVEHLIYKVGIVKSLKEGRKNFHSKNFDFINCGKSSL